MLEKAILVVCDGLGDRPVKELGGLTPLEAARTPNLDRLAAEGECGLMHTLGRGKRPGSDTAHLAILGYDPDTSYCGRGPIEVAGLGMDLRHGDVALRGNVGTVDEGWTVTDRRAGRIDDTSPITQALDGLEVDGVTFIVKPGTGHRAGVVMRGTDLSDAITDADPHEVGVKVHEVEPKDDSAAAKRTARVLNAFMKKAYQVLKDLPFNREREKAGHLPGNFLLVRGAGQYRAVEPFQERFGLAACCIAGGGLYKGIGAYLGMSILDVPGATGKPDTDVEAKLRRALEALKEYQFIFLHIKGADTLAEDGNAAGKKEFIEKIDRAARLFVDLPAEVLLVWTADHTTPCELKQHAGDPVPIFFRGAGVRVDDVTALGERACAKGGLGHLRGLDVMPQVVNLLGRLPLMGA